MANRSSRPKPNRRKTAKSTPGPVTVTVTLLVLAVSVFSVATWDRYAFAEINLFPLWYVALALGLLWYRTLSGESIANCSFRDTDEPVEEALVATAIALVESLTM